MSDEVRMTLETAEAYYNRGRHYFREREFILALANFNAAVSLNPYHGSEDYIDSRHLKRTRLLHGSSGEEECRLPDQSRRG